MDFRRVLAKNATSETQFEIEFYIDLIYYYLTVPYSNPLPIFCFGSLTQVQSRPQGLNFFSKMDPHLPILDHQN